MSNLLGGGAVGTAYRGTKANQPPNWTFSDRAPTEKDSYNYNLGDLWLDKINEEIYCLVSLKGSTTSAGLEAFWENLSTFGEGLKKVVTDAGDVIPVDEEFDIFGGANINTSGAGRTVTVNLNHSLSLPATSADMLAGVLGIGGNPFLHGYGDGNTFVGPLAGNFTLDPVVSSFNTALGAAALANISTGALNVALGVNAGLNYVGAESSNLLINSAGVIGESNSIRIGTQGSGVGQQNKAFIAGVHNVTTALGDELGVRINSEGQLSTGPTAGGTKITSYDTPGTFTWTKDPNCKEATVYVWGGGGGGGSGARYAVEASGGSGGGVQSACKYTIPGEFLGATETVVVGAGGMGAEAVTTDDTFGNDGANGEASFFGNISTDSKHHFPALQKTRGQGGLPKRDVGGGYGAYLETDSYVKQYILENDQEKERGYTWDGGNGNLDFGYTPGKTHAIPGPERTILKVRATYHANFHVRYTESVWVLLSDGSLYATGKNKNGHFGLGDYQERHKFTLVASDVTDFDIVSIKCSATSYIVKNGQLYTAGGNKKGLLGIGRTEKEVRDSQVWVPAVGAASSGVTKVYAGVQEAFILKTDAIYGVGENLRGQLGIGNNNTRTSFTAAIGQGASGVSDIIIVGGDGSMDNPEGATMILKGGAVYGTGYNGDGELGLGHSTNVNQFTAAVGEGAASVDRLIGGKKNSFIIKSGALYGTGENSFGVLGTGGVSKKTSYTAAINEGSAGVDDLVATVAATYILKAGAVYATGANTYGELGVGDTVFRHEFTACINEGSSGVDELVGAKGSIKQKSPPQQGTHALIRKGAAVYSCGVNFSGQLGLGDTVNRNEFTLAPGFGSSGVEHIYAFGGTSFVAHNNLIYAAGGNSHGQLGVGDAGLSRSTFTHCDGLQMSSGFGRDTWNLEWANGYARGNLFLMPTSAGGGGGTESAAAHSGGYGQSICKRYPSDYHEPVADDFLIAGGLQGTVAAPNGGNGNDAPATGAFPCGGTGGGGGASAIGAAAGNGGNGGWPGGAGGGGGASQNGHASGKGGNGAGGRVLVLEHLG